jgi:hypothetical protein
MPRSRPPSNSGRLNCGPMPSARAPGTEIAQLHGLRAEVAGQGDARIKIALGHADAGGGGVQARLGLADVRTAFGQLRRQADGDLQR